MSRLLSIGPQFFDNNGDPLAGGKLTFYATGTTTLTTTYSDSAETVPNANPVILDASGRMPDVFYPGFLKIVLTDKDDVIIETRDPVGFAAGANGIPDGGTDGQVLTKLSATDFDADWETPAGGGGDWWTFSHVAAGGFTAVAGTYYTAAAGTLGDSIVTLPASPSVNDRVGIAVGTRDDGSNDMQINRNGSLINGGSGGNTTHVVGDTGDTNHRHVALVYSGATYGWVVFAGGLHAAS